jgi:folylpolyglutamate synthase/dihydropteroate synthase
MTPTYAEVERALLGRWPETRLEPSLDRIAALCRLLGDPQLAYPVVHLTGTNGKTSTSRMIDTLLRALDLRTGRFTSPHLQSMTERISLDGVPLTEAQFVDAFADVAAWRIGCLFSRPSWRWPSQPSPMRQSMSRSSRSAWEAPGMPRTSPTAKSR